MKIIKIHDNVYLDPSKIEGYTIKTSPGGMDCWGRCIGPRKYHVDLYVNGQGFGAGRSFDTHKEATTWANNLIEKGIVE